MARDPSPSTPPSSRGTRRAAAQARANARALARTPRQAFWHGIVQSTPMLLVIMPFGILFGIVAREASMDLAQIMGFSVIVLAGAAQFTAVQMLVDQAPLALVIASALAVNLRMAMYSAAMVPWLGESRPSVRALLAYTLIDQTYALSIRHFEDHPKLSLSQRLGYFFGTALMLCGPWVIATLIGATAGEFIPADWPLDFAVPITFLAMIAPSLRSLPHQVAACVAMLAGLGLAGLPAGVGLMLAALLAMMAGAGTEIWLERRVAAQAKGGAAHD